MNNLNDYISKKLDIIFENDDSKTNPTVVANKLKSMGVSNKVVKKAVERMKSMNLEKPKSKNMDSSSEDDLFPGRIHSDDEIKDIIRIRKLLRGKSPKVVEKSFNAEREAFIAHYNNLFNNGASELPGIFELYSLFKTKRARPSVGKGYSFKLTPEDAKKFGKDIVKYFLVKNSDVFPMSTRAKIALDSYLEVLGMSKVEPAYITKTKNFYYKKYNLDK